MKKYFFLTLFSLGIFFIYPINAQNISKGKINLSQIDYIRENFNWNEENHLIIAYKFGREHCHYDHYDNELKSARWILKLMDNAELKNSKNIFVSFETGLNAVTKNEHKRIYLDIDKYLFNNFSMSNSFCYCVIVLNETGEYILRNGEFVEDDIKKLVHNLNVN